MKLARRTALITGAASGIGLATARRFVAEGARVMLADCADPTAAAASLAASPESRWRDHHGRHRCRGGATGGRQRRRALGPTRHPRQHRWHRPVENGARHHRSRVGPRARGEPSGGTIVNMASELGLVGCPANAAYCASKGAIVTLTKAMAIDHAKEGIRINCICPGPIDTPLLDRVLAESPAQGRAFLEAGLSLGRIGQADEIAKAMVFLASEDASYMTGAALTVDGGWTAQ